MNKFLKGNYEIVNSNKGNSEIIEEDFSRIFEAKSLEKLGGSIAFVMKSDKFLWEEEENVK